MRRPRRVIAVGLGGGSIRVISVDLEASVPRAEVIHRWRNAPIRASDGSQRWDWPRIVAEVETGLAKARASGAIASIGVDSWANDYGIVDAAGELVGLPYSYRDERTNRRPAAHVALGTERIEAITGQRLVPFATFFQLAVHDRRERDDAAAILLLPDLLVHHLTGFAGAERSNASTSSLLDVTTGDRSDELPEPKTAQVRDLISQLKYGGQDLTQAADAIDLGRATVHRQGHGAIIGASSLMSAVPPG